jgi:ADP-ribose pyrophosphatase YjhB (NUDIX family)
VVTETVPKLLQWARQLQAIAQTGVAYDEPTLHDRERYAQVQRIAAEMLATDGRVDALEGWFGREKGHATPKLDVRGAVFRGDWILLVRERSHGKWSLPGGWVDVGESPSEAVVREIREETGYDTRAVKLVGLYDRDKHAREPHLWHVWKAFFLCELLDEVQHEVDEEISEARFFPRAGIPELDVGRMTPDIYLEHIYAHREHPEWPTDFD